MFTETDFRILDSYKSVLDGLAAYLGDGYEIVLHSLHDLDHSVIKIINGHYTGRREGFPITDLAPVSYTHLGAYAAIDGILARGTPPSWWGEPGCTSGR